MIPEDDIGFCKRRETEERSAAVAAVDPMVEHIHLVMADRYAERVRAVEEAGFATLPRLVIPTV